MAKAKRRQPVWNSAELFLSQTSSTTNTYDAILDVTADGNPFSAGGFVLKLQNIDETIVLGPGGLHASATIAIDASVSADQQKLAVYFYAPMQYGVDLKFAISLTPVDSQLHPDGDAISWSLSWTTSAQKPALLKGNVPLSAFKSASPGNGAAKGDK